LNQASRWERVAELFEQTTSLPVDERETFIHTACGDDAELRDELTSLLRAHLAAGPLDAEPAFSADDAPEVSEVGLEVGAYRLLRPISEGGMGSVWLAERSDGVLKRLVALKRPHISWTGALAARMAQERDILATLEHPNIARLYDAGVDAQGRPYLALEYVEGVPISDYCDRANLSLEARLTLFLQVLDAVRFAHAHLVIHRDIKPSNILVSAAGRVHLLDFGIAKLLQDGPNDARTQWAGELTPDYASPEQISGGLITTASDVYSLGVLLSELLCGSRPYELKRSSRGALEEAILEAEPRAPSRNVSARAAQTRGVKLNTLKRLLGGDLDGIVLKALQKRPEARYGTADLLAQDITRHLRGEPILAHRGSTLYYAGKLLRRHKAAAGLGAFALSALIAGAAVALWQAHAARLEAARADQVKGFVLSILESADSDSGAGAATTAVDLLRTASQKVEHELKGRPAIAAELMTAIGYGLLGQGHPEDAVELLQNAIRLSTAANGALDARTLAAQVIYGEALYTLGKNDEAITLLVPAAKRARQLRDSHLEVDALRWLSSAQADKGDVEAGIASARAAVAALEVGPISGGHALRDALQAHLSLANMLNNARQPGVVEEARITQGIAARMTNESSKSATIAAQELLGLGLAREGNVAQALKEIEAAYAAQRAFQGDEHPETEIALEYLANVRLEAGDVQGAVAAFQTDFDSVTRHAADRGPGAVAYANFGLAAALAAAGDWESALPHLDAAVQKFGETQGPTSNLTLRALAARARTLAELGRINDADRAFAQLDTMPFTGTEKAGRDGGLAELRSRQGRHAEALQLALASAEQLKDFPSKTTRAQSQARLGKVQLAAGQPDEAIHSLERSVALYREGQVQESPEFLKASLLLDRARAAPRTGGQL